MFDNRQPNFLLVKSKIPWFKSSDLLDFKITVLTDFWRNSIQTRDVLLNSKKDSWVAPMYCSRNIFEKSSFGKEHKIDRLWCWLSYQHKPTSQTLNLEKCFRWIHQCLPAIPAWISMKRSFSLTKILARNFDKKAETKSWPIYFVDFWARVYIFVLNNLSARFIFKTKQMEKTNPCHKK